MAYKIKTNDIIDWLQEFCNFIDCIVILNGKHLNIINNRRNPVHKWVPHLNNSVLYLSYWISTTYKLQLLINSLPWVLQVHGINLN